MAPLPESNTPRLFVDYHDGQNPHTLLVRYAASGGSDNAMDAAAAFFEALSPNLYFISITGARLAASGSNITLPIPWTGSPDYGSGVMPKVNAPRQVCFLGRSETGRRVRWFMYGWSGAFPEDYKQPVEDLTTLQAAYEALILFGGLGAFLAIDLFTPTVYPYVDFNFNSYYEQKNRG